ncbi:long-chain-fatty-acid--CoA ligase, partial [Leucobacter sp. M11]|uniref:long-chain-fatty-acid--CoA ligase n=1 Tax=Leucobacter sp. M11 TaxID=2993565 RepID=UPI002D7F3337
EGLRALGVKHGDPVAIVLPNCPQHIAAFYAVLRIGAVVVEHNPLYTPRELRHQFEDHGAKVVIAWDKVVGAIQAFPQDMRPNAIVSVNVTRSMPALMRLGLSLPVPALRSKRAQLTTRVRGGSTWEELVSALPIAATVPRPECDDIAVIQYTSGTTGRPKGAVLTHRNLIANAAQSRAWVPTIERGEGCVVYAVLPMFHAYGLTLCLTFAMSMGARLVLFPKFDPELVLKVVKKRPPTFLPAVPPICEKLMHAADEAGVSLEGIQIGISGAMPLNEALVVPWEERTRGFLVEGYGLSECSPVLMANPVADNRKAGTVGLPLPDTEVRIVDPEHPDTAMPTGEAGELLVRGPQVFSGYWRKPEESAQVFHDGWFRTGDIATLDAEGFVTIVDRIKELIITGGFNVSPSEVEHAMELVEGIEDVAVVGMPSEHSGEEVVAAVVMKPGAPFDPEAIRAGLRGTLTPYKVPRRIVQVDELPRSLIGKVLRREVVAKLNELDA